jgi:SnoaL-like domain
MSHPFRAAIEARDQPAMLATLAPDVVLHSPISFKPFEGKEAVKDLFSVLLEVFEGFHYTDELTGPGVHALIFRTRIGNRTIEGIDLLRDREDGLVADFTVMVRPLSGAIALAEAVGPRLAALTADRA